MSPEDLQYLNPKEAQLQKCKQRMNFFNISIQEAANHKKELQQAIKSVFSKLFLTKPV